MGSAVRRMREARSLSQTGLAKLMDRSQQAISNWESGDPSLDIVLEVAERLALDDVELSAAIGDPLAKRLGRVRAAMEDPDPEPPASSGLPPDDEYWIAAKSGANLSKEDRQVIVDMVRRLRARQVD